MINCSQFCSRFWLIHGSSKIHFLNNFHNFCTDFWELGSELKVFNFITCPFWFYDFNLKFTFLLICHLSNGGKHSEIWWNFVSQKPRLKFHFKDEMRIFETISDQHVMKTEISDFLKRTGISGNKRMLLAQFKWHNKGLQQIIWFILFNFLFE